MAEKKQFKMDEVFALWKRKSKGGNDYFTGKTTGDDGIKLRGFFNTNKKNPKEPDLRVYTLTNDNDLSEKPLISMWCNVSKSGGKYLTGKIGEQRYVGFIRKDDNEKAPYLTVYASKEVEKEAKHEVKQEAKAPF